MTLFELVGNVVIKNQEAKAALKETSETANDAANDVEGSGSKMTDTFKKIGAAVATYLTLDAIKNFGSACINAAADANAASSQFSQVFGDLEGTASQSLTNIADTAGISENRMKGSYTKIAAFAKTTGMETEDALSLADRAMVAVADSAAFYDRSLEETTESLQSFLKGNYENDAALGLSCTETTRNAAANALYGKSFNELSESQKQLTLLQMVEDANAASGALGQAARESDTWTNVTGNLQQAWTDFQAVIGSYVLEGAVEVVKKMVSAIEDWSAKIPDLVNWCKEHETTLTVLGIAIGTVVTAIGLYTAAEALKNIAVAAGVAAEGSATVGMGLYTVATNIATAASSAFGAVMAFITSPITLVVVAIGALIAIGVALYKNWDEVTEFCSQMWEKIKEIWANIKESISEKIDEIKTAISEKFTAAKEKIAEIFNAVKDTLSTVWETMKNVVQVGLMFIVELVKAAFDLITLPFRFIWENCKDTIMAAWDAIKTAVSNALDTIKTTISNVWNAIANLLSPILNTIKNAISTAWDSIKSAISTALNAIKSVVSSVWNSIKSAISSVLNSIRSVVSSVWNSIKSVVSSVMNSIKSTISSVWNSVKSVVSSAINGVKSTISSGLNAAKSVVFGVLDGIKNKFSSIFEGAKTIVGNAINTIKGFFNFSWSLPKLKMPHLTISGKFSINPPSVPKFSISWYKKAMDNVMILNSPTIFGYSAASGKMLGGGEAGSEVVAGANTLMNMIGSVVESKTAEQNEHIISVLTALLDAIVGGNEELLKALLAGQTIKLNEREFGRAVREYA